MPAIFDLLYREYCRARIAEMRKQLLISPEGHEAPEAIFDAKVAVGANPVVSVTMGRQRKVLWQCRFVGSSAAFSLPSANDPLRPCGLCGGLFTCYD